MTKELAALEERVARALAEVTALEHAQRLLSAAQERGAALEARVRDEETSARREGRDVERLAGKGPLALFYTVLGSLEHRRDKERQELVAAELRLDEARAEHELVSGDIAALTDRVAALAGAPARLEEARGARLAWLPAPDEHWASAIAAVDEGEAALAVEEQQLAEALAVAKQAERAIADILADLGRAGGWGALDLLGGGMISSMVKHNHLDAARQRLPELQNLLHRLRQECADVGLAFAAHAGEIHQGGRFIDTFFDNLISDWTSQSEIGSAQNGVDECRRRVAGVMGVLARRQRELAPRREALAEDRRRLADG
jgi:hypothetical protein